MKESEQKVAVFIDAENIGYTNADQIFDLASGYGNVIIKKIYGDWSKEGLKPWKDMISKYSIVAEQQFSFASSKNSSDISLIIQVLLALFEKDINVFIIASGDSDFTRLVQELRERKKTVIGMGGRNSIQSFVNSFDEFIYLGETAQAKQTESVVPNDGKKPENKLIDNIGKDKISSLRVIIDSLIENNGRALYSQISTDMKNKYSDFVPKNYGCKSLKDFINNLLFYLKQYKVGVDSDNTTLFLEYKNKPSEAE
jgi:uncharacterized LabA/DUF88 family protein